jgi:pyruvate dehydrogenase kinase 2/3/4
MLRSRIARRVLAEQHVALTTQYHDTVEHGPLQDSHRYIGIIDTSLAPYESIKALETILPRVTGIQGIEIVIDGENAKNIRFAFINDHIQFIAFELIKNSILAAVKNGNLKATKKVFITISETDSLIGIRISDECEQLLSSYQSYAFADKSIWHSWRNIA